MNISKVLIVVDPQNDFITGALGSKEAQGIVSNIVNKLEKLDNDTFVFFTKDTHNEVEYKDSQEGMHLPILHCLKDTWGYEFEPNIEQAWLEREKRFLKYIANYSEDTDFINELDFYYQNISELKEESTIYKNYFSIGEKIKEIFSNHTDTIESFELIGYCTDVCVIANAMLFKSYYPEIEIIVDASCCAGITPEKHKAALEAMKSCQITVINE